MANRVSQDGIEVVRAGNPHVRTSQFGIEVVRSAPVAAQHRVSQFGIEIVRSAPFVGAPFIASVTAVHAPALIGDIGVPFIASVTTVHAPTVVAASVEVDVPFIGSNTLVYPLHLYDPNRTGVGPGNSGETFLIELAPNGTSVVATLTAGIGSGPANLVLTGDTGMPATRPFVVKVGAEVIYVIKIGPGTYRTHGRGLSNTTAALHAAGASVTWDDSYDMAVASTSDLDASFTASDVPDHPGTYTFDGWLVCFDSTQGYLGGTATRYPLHVSDLLGVFDAGAGATGTNRLDSAQPAAIFTPPAATDHCPIGLCVPARIVSFITAGDVALVRYTNPAAQTVDIGPRSVGIQSLYGLGRYDYEPGSSPDYLEDMDNPKAMVVDTRWTDAPVVGGNVFGTTFTDDPTHSGWAGWSIPYDSNNLGGGDYQAYTGTGSKSGTGVPADDNQHGLIYGADDWTPADFTYWKLTYTVRRIVEQAGHWANGITNYGIDTDEGALVSYGPQGGLGGGGGVISAGKSYNSVTGDPLRPPELTGDWVTVTKTLFVDTSGSVPWYVGFAGTKQPYTGVAPFNQYGYAFEIKDVSLELLDTATYFSSGVITEPAEPLALQTGISREPTDTTGVETLTPAPVPWLTVTLPGADRFLTVDSLPGIPIGALAVRQGNRRVPFWESWDWTNFTYAYAGFGPDCTYTQQLIELNGVYNFLPQFDYPTPDDADGPDTYWDDATYYYAACWYVCLLKTPVPVAGGSFVGTLPFLMGGPSNPIATHASGGSTVWPVISGGHPVLGGGGGDITPPTIPRELFQAALV